VVFEDLQPAKGTGTVIVQSDLSHPKLFPAVTGHVVNKRVLCPSTLYADMAMTVADYLYSTLRPSAPPVGLNVCAMEVHKPLVAELPPSPDGQHIQLEAHAELASGIMKLNIRSVTWDGQTLQDHGHGLVKYEDPATWTTEWQQINYLVRNQITLLETKLENGSAHKILRGMAYKLFETLVTYSPKYQGMEEVILDNTDTIATAKIKFQVTPGADGDYFCSPFFVDNLCHLSGFIVNAADVESAEPLVYISHGWHSLKFLKPKEISPDREYRSFVRMMDQGKNVSAGDVYVFEGDDIVAVLYGLRFQGIPQRLMDVLLPAIRNSGATFADGGLAAGKGKSERKKVKEQKRKDSRGLGIAA